MNHDASHSELFHSCRILFGPELHCSRDFLEYLQIGGVKSAFRRRAKETHPDRFCADGQADSRFDSSSFQMVRQAYENLLGYLIDKEKGLTAPPVEAATSTSSVSRSAGGQGRIRPVVLPKEFCNRPGASSTEHYYRGDLPERVLLFGHFLYYSGLANWRTIARILAWQRSERPRLGELGLRYGYLNREDIALVLKRRRPLAPFGQTARGLGLLGDRQLQLLLTRQQQLQKKFGTILLEKNLLKDYELQELLQRFQDHNHNAACLRRN